MICRERVWSQISVVSIFLRLVLLLVDELLACHLARGVEGLRHLEDGGDTESGMRLAVATLRRLPASLGDERDVLEVVTEGTDARDELWTASARGRLAM